MAIYIKGVELPKTAFECSTKINPDERRCNYTGKVFEETFGLLVEHTCPDCPLVYIPEPHGGLIDGDVLYKELVKESDYLINEIENQEKNPNEYTDNFRIYTSYVLSGLSSAMISLYNTPPVIEGSE